MDLAQATGELRTTLALTQQAFAERLGISLRSVAHYERGRPANAAALQRLTELAREAGRPDLAMVFSATNRPDEHQQLRTEAAEQKLWTDAVIALLRSNTATSGNRPVAPSWPPWNDWFSSRSIAPTNPSPRF